MLENRSKLIFISCTLTAGMIFLQMGLYLLHVLFNWKIGFNVIQLCEYEIRSLGLSSLQYVVDALVFYTILLTIWKSFRQFYLSTKMYKRLMSYRNEALTYEINQKYHSPKPEFTIIGCSAPLAFTFGYLNPQIILSTGLLDLLEKNELDAVIQHELYHKRHRDPFKIFWLSLLASVMWYIPILKWLYFKYKMMREVLADNHAINKLGTRIGLGSALLKLLKTGDTRQLPFSYVSFADTAINFRIKKIIDPDTEIPLQLPLKPTAVSIYVLLVLYITFVIVLQ